MNGNPIVADVTENIDVPTHDEFGRRLAYIPQVDEIPHSFDREYNSDENVPDYDTAPNVVTSVIAGGESHRPIFDFDFPCRLVESSTPGHFHFYMDGIKLDADQWSKVLDVLQEVGIVQEGWVNTFRREGFTALRLPGVPKKKPLGLDDVIILKSDRHFGKFNPIPDGDGKW